MEITALFSFDIAPAPTIRIVDILNSGGVLFSGDYVPSWWLAADTYSESTTVISATSQDIQWYAAEIFCEGNLLPSFDGNNTMLWGVDEFSDYPSTIVPEAPPSQVSGVDIFEGIARIFQTQDLPAILDYLIAEIHDASFGAVINFDIAYKLETAGFFLFNVKDKFAEAAFDFTVAMTMDSKSATFSFDVITGEQPEQSVEATFSFDVIPLTQYVKEATFSYDVTALIFHFVEALFSYDVTGGQQAAGGGVEAKFSYDIRTLQTYTMTAAKVLFNIIEIWIPIAIPGAVTVKHGSYPKGRTTMHHVYCRVYQGNIFVGTMYKVFSTSRNSFGLVVTIRDIPELSPDMTVHVYVDGRLAHTDVTTYSRGWTTTLWLLPE